MPNLYFSSCSPDSKSFVRKIVNECNSYLEAECILREDDRSFSAEEIRDCLSRSDALIVVLGNDREILLSERIRIEIISAINLNVMIIPLLLDPGVLPEKVAVTGALKRLLEFKTYRLRSGFWYEDLHQLLENIEEELEFKKDVEKKLSQPYKFNFQGRSVYTGETQKTPKSDLDSCGPSGLERVIDSENLILSDARRKGDRRGENEALATLGLVYSRLGQTQKAIQYFQQQLEIVRGMGDAEEICDLLANLGDASAISGNDEQARNYYKEQLELAESGNFRAFIGSAYNGLGFVCVKQGKLLDGVNCYLKALAVYKELENHEKELELLVGIGLNYQKLEELKLAIDYFESALKISRYLENRNEEVQILVDCGEISFQLRDKERLSFYIKKADDFLRHMDGRLVDSLSKRLITLQDSLEEWND